MKCESWWFASKASFVRNNFHQSPKSRQFLLCAWRETYWPVRRNSGPGSNHICKHIRQAVTLTGLGSKSFGEGVDNIAQAYMKFITFFPEDQLELWQPTMFNPHVAIDAHSRYFTERRFSPQEPNIPFGPMVDPKGILTSIQGNDFIHGQDNYVEYLEHRLKDGNSRWVQEKHDIQFINLHIETHSSYVETNPLNIRVGDIVEVQLAFVTIPVAKEKFRMLICLRGITLLESGHRNVSQYTTTRQCFLTIFITGGSTSTNVY